MKLVECGLYTIKDKYFSDFKSDRHMHNKSEGRPYYLSIQMKNGIVWFIPLSSKVEKNKAKIAQDESKFGDCLFYHIMDFMGGERALLIGNMIPVTQEYIKQEFTIMNRQYVVRNVDTVKAVRKKAARYLSLVRNGKLRPYVDILKIERQLISRMSNSAYIV